MSGRGGGRRGNGAVSASASAAPIPTGTRKLVQSLKEIVNCPEPEIYAMLRECNMDPNEAVHRLLSQDTFHEVKSKRDNKKETREAPESRSRTMNNNSGRGARSISERGGRSTSQSTDYMASRGKPVLKNDNSTSAVPTSSVLESASVSNNPTRQTTISSNSASMGTTIQIANIADGICTPMLSSSGFQNSWLGKPGHVSMADIVKMGRPHGRPCNMAIVASERSYMASDVVIPNMSHHNAKQSSTAVLESDKRIDSFQESAHVSEISHGHQIAEAHHISHDGWSQLDDQSTESGSTTPEISGASAVYENPAEYASSNLAVDVNNFHIDPHSEEIQMPEESLNVKTLPVESRSTFVPGQQIQVDISVDASHLNEGLLSMNSYQSQRLELGHHEAEDVSVEISSAAEDLRHLSLHEETSTKSIEASPAVIIPDHLRVTNADCAHLSFGSFGSGALSDSFSLKPLKGNLEVAPVVDDACTIENSDVRNHEYYSNGQLKPLLSEKVASRSGTGTENVDVPLASQAEVVRNDTSDVTRGLQYNFPSVSSYEISISAPPNVTAYTYPHGNAQMQSLSPFSSLMQPSTLQNSILAASIPPLRDFDLTLSPLLPTQSMPTKYSITVSSISGATISMPEAMKPGPLSNPQSTPESLTNTTMITSPVLPQHLPVHYSQPALPLGHFANIISYPFLPPSFTCLPSAAFQQSYNANSSFHQSPAVIPSAGIKYSQPQYKRSFSAASLPQASPIASAYGGFGSSASILPGYAFNHTTASASTAIGLDEALSLQFKEGSHYMPLQQSENPAMWVHGVGSRAMSAVPASTFQNYQDQSQHSGLRQSQQASQFGALGYPNLYHPQAGLSRVHQQNHSEGNLSGSQTMHSQSTNQIWQHGY